MSGQKQIEFTPEKAEQLRKAYNKAVEEKKDSFVFQGDEFVTSYAKYLLEYLDMQFGKKS